MANKRRRRKKSTGKLYVFVVMMAIFGILGMQLFSLNNKKAAYKKTEMELQKQLDEAKLKQQQLKDMEEYVHTDKYAEETAKGKLGMIYGNEIIFREK